MDPDYDDARPATAGAHALRFDPLTGDWVLIAPHRQSRPNLPDTGCPFCVGGLEAPEPYDVRVFENRWPPLLPGAAVDLVGTVAGDEDGAVESMTRREPRGAAEVVLFSPDHEASLATIGVEGVLRVVDVWVERTEALLARSEIEYVLVFENRGAAVGATIHHPHGQIYGYAFVPPTPAREIAVAVDGCPVCRELEAEIATAERIVFDDGEWVAWVPFASAHAYGLRLAPRAHLGRLSDLDAPRRRALAAALGDVLGRYERLWPRAPEEGPFPYLMWFHQAPAHHHGEYHVHAHIAPPLRGPGVLRYVASGELGGGMLANPILPERAAADLRAAAAS
jgi:UDPglucose--hexose-1-phosphate uridylyltransferase